MKHQKHTTYAVLESPPTQDQVTAALPVALKAAQDALHANASHIGLVDVPRLVAYRFTSSLPAGTTIDQIVHSLLLVDWAQPTYRTDAQVPYGA